MMVRPASFQFNHQTAQSNEFQNEITKMSKKQILSKAREEFDEMISELNDKGIEVEIIDDSEFPEKPDAIFPNNWISMSHQSIMTIFPMKNENRRLEKRVDIIERIKKKYHVDRLIDLSEYESQDRALEGTGSIVFDHNDHVAYACLSPRTDEEIFKNYCHQINYKPVVFHSYDSNGTLIYHTNVVMCVGSGYVVIGGKSIAKIDEKNTLYSQFKKSGLEVVELDDSQLLQNFAGNMLQVQGENDNLYLVMSKRAFGSLKDSQKEKLSKYVDLLPVSIDIIETIGGGSARCMMAEIFLTSKEK